MHLSSTLTYSRIFYAGKVDTAGGGSGDDNAHHNNDDDEDMYVLGGSRPSCISATNDENDWNDNFATPPR